MPAVLAPELLARPLRLATMRLARRLRGQRAESDLTASQIAALSTLDRHGPLAPGTLAQHERVRPPSMTRVVAALEEAGFVARAPHPTDRRQYLLGVTDEGRALLQEGRRRSDAWLAERLAALSAAERRTLVAAVEILERLAAS